MKGLKRNMMTYFLILPDLKLSMILYYVKGKEINTLNHNLMIFFDNKLFINYLNIHYDK